METPQVIDNKYRIMRVLGQGGCGTVFVAWHEQLQKEVAVKVLSGEQPEATELKRFQQEAQALTTCKHPNIVQITAFGVTPESRPYYVMNYIDGISLAAEVREHGPVTPTRFNKIFDQILSALEHAHQAGLVHRDIKPSNIMLTTGGGIEKAILIDFGLTRSIQARDIKLTADHAIIGTPQYMSPEQCTGGTVDARSDIYSLGCTMLEAATGKLPFTGEAFQILFSQVNEAPNTVPRELLPLMEGCLAKEPEKRFPNATAARACLQLLQLERYQQFSTGKHSLSTSVAAIKTRLPKSASSRKQWVIAALCLALLCLAGTSYALYQQQQQSKKEMPKVASKADKEQHVYELGIKDRAFAEAVEADEAHNAVEAAKKYKYMLDEFYPNGDVNDNKYFRAVMGYGQYAAQAAIPVTEWKPYLERAIKLCQTRADDVHFKVCERDIHNILAKGYAIAGDPKSTCNEYEAACALALKYPDADPNAYSPLLDYSVYLRCLRKPESESWSHFKRSVILLRDYRKHNNMSVYREDVYNQFPEFKHHGDEKFKREVAGDLAKDAENVQDAWVRTHELAAAGSIYVGLHELQKAKQLYDRATAVAQKAHNITLEAFSYHARLSTIPMNSQESVDLTVKAYNLIKGDERDSQLPAISNAAHFAALAHEQNGKRAETAEYYQKSVEAAVKEADLLERQGQIFQAWDCYTRILQDDATHATWHMHVLGERAKEQAFVNDCIKVINHLATDKRYAVYASSLESIKTGILSAQHGHRPW